MNPTLYFLDFCLQFHIFTVTYLTSLLEWVRGISNSSYSKLSSLYFCHTRHWDELNQPCWGVYSTDYGWFLPSEVLEHYSSCSDNRSSTKLSLSYIYTSSPEVVKRYKQFSSSVSSSPASFTKIQILSSLNFIYFEFEVCHNFPSVTAINSMQLGWGLALESRWWCDGPDLVAFMTWDVLREEGEGFWSYMLDLSAQSLTRGYGNLENNTKQARKSKSGWNIPPAARCPPWLPSWASFTDGTELAK